MKTVAVCWLIIFACFWFVIGGCASVPRESRQSSSKSKPGCIRVAPPAAAAAEERHDVTVDPVGFVLVEFSAAWCGPCKRQAPNVEALMASPGGFNNVYSIDVDQNVEAAQRAIINDDHPAIQVPCHIVFKDGVEVVRHYGIHSRDEMLTWLDEAKSAAAR